MTTEPPLGSPLLAATTVGAIWACSAVVVVASVLLAAGATASRLAVSFRRATAPPPSNLSVEDGDFSVAALGTLSTVGAFAQGSFGLAITHNSGRSWAIVPAPGAVAGGRDVRHLFALAVIQKATPPL